MSIASYVDTYYCFKKYYNTEDRAEICDGCDFDIKTMCVGGGNYVSKEYYDISQKNKKRYTRAQVSESINCGRKTKIL